MIKTTLSTLAVLTSLNVASVFAAGNIEVEESVKLNVKPAAVWALLGDYNGLYSWHPAVAASDRDDKVRVLTLGNGAQITETLLAQNGEGRSYRYQIDKSPLPVADYESEIQVQAGEYGGSLVVWKSSFNASGATDKEAEDVI